MRARDINIPSDGDSRQTDQGKSKKGATAKLRPWEVSNQDRYASTSDQKGKAPASDELKDLHKGNAAGKDSQPSSEKKAESMHMARIQEEEPMNPVSAWSKELEQNLPWTTMQLKPETLKTIAEFAIWREEEVVRNVVEDVVRDVEADFQSRIAHELHRARNGMFDDPDTMFSREEYEPSPMSPEQNSMFDKSDTMFSREEHEPSPMSPEQNNTFDDIASKFTDWLWSHDQNSISHRGEDNRKGKAPITDYYKLDPEPASTPMPDRPQSSNRYQSNSFENRSQSQKSKKHLDRQASISSNSDEWFFSAPNSPLRDNEKQEDEKLQKLAQEKKTLEDHLQKKNDEISKAQQTITDLKQALTASQSELDRLRVTSSVQAETLDSRPNQQGSTSLQETAIANQEKDPASSRSEDLNKRSSVRDSKQKHKQARSVLRNFSWSGLAGVCRSTKDTQVEQTHISRQKPQQGEARKSATEAEPS